MEALVKRKIDILYTTKCLKELHPAQHGFRPTLGTETNILRLLIDTKIIKEDENKAKDNFLTFFDFAQALDSVDWEVLT